MPYPNDTRKQVRSFFVLTQCIAAITIVGMVIGEPFLLSGTWTPVISLGLTPIIDWLTEFGILAGVIAIGFAVNLYLVVPPAIRTSAEKVDFQPDRMTVWFPSPEGGTLDTSKVVEIPYSAIQGVRKEGTLLPPRVFWNVMPTLDFTKVEPQSPARGTPLTPENMSRFLAQYDSWKSTHPQPGSPMGT